MTDFVIVVDTQADFMLPDGALPVPGADALVAPMNAWLSTLRPAQTAGVLFTQDTHDPTTYPASAEARLFPPHCMRGTKGWANVLDAGRVDPAIPIHVLHKGVFAMWDEPDLVVADLRAPDAPPVPREVFFATLKARGIDHVTVIGVAADYCVRWAVEGLVARGFHVTVLAALTRGIDRAIAAVAAAEWAEAPVVIA